MKIFLPAFRVHEMIPDRYALCNPAPADEGRVQMGANVNPEIRWSEVPVGTRSMALLVVDPDAPASREGANEEGTSLAVNRERTNFYHWVVVDIPPAPSKIKEGADSNGVIPGGKPPGQVDYGVRGCNSYTEWFEGDEEMEGVYGGYDGPCPPWNDERMHHYHFQLFALDVATLDLPRRFTGDDLAEAIKGHVLAEAEVVRTYTLNPELR